MSPHDEPAGVDADSLAACVQLMQGGSRTFFAASRLLPPRMRDAAIALYAFCRVADDLIDESGPAQAPLHLLARRLDRIYAGRPEDHVEDRALGYVVREHQLPRPLLDALLEGFAWDTTGRTYETLQDVQDYAARVAGTVGAMMCWIMGARAADTLARACELGVAMQLTNIARDVGADAAMGRLYLPRDWMVQAGMDVPAWQGAPEATPALRGVVARLLHEADRLYVQSRQGIAALPPDCRAAILAASHIYGEIGHQLRREGLDSVTHRTVVGTPRKLVLLLRAWAEAPWIRLTGATPRALPAIDFLVRACPTGAEVPADELHPSNGYFPNRPMPQRVAWVIDLLERREHERRALARGRSASPMHPSPMA